MSARRHTSSPALCATTCCSVFVTFRSGQPNYRGDDCQTPRSATYEAQRSGNIDFDLHADWIDYEAAGVEDARRCRGASPRCWPVSTSRRRSIRWGCVGASIPEAHPGGGRSQLLEARKALARRLVEDGITNLVETYDPERFNLNASVAENLLFGTPIGPAFDFEALADNTYVCRF